MVKKFRFPGELLASYGIKSMIEDLDKVKAVKIPDLLQSAFAVPFTANEIEKFHKITLERNAVARGSAGPLDMRKATETGLFLRKLDVKTADHLSKHFFVIERFAP